MMRKPLLRTVIVATAAALAAGAAHAQQQTPSPSAAEPGIAQILAAVESQGYTAVESIEKDDGVWEVEAMSPRGTRVELSVDPTDGRILEEEEDD